jgi:XTP/dITP diphosphohydrolase
MRKELVIATRNKGKFAEIVAELKDLPFEFFSLDDRKEISQDFSVSETASTFEGNAILKATTIGKMTKILTLSDDSGLEVDALGGRPGVLSARYVHGTDEDRFRKLLKELKDVPDEKRGAQFHAVIALYDPAAEKIRTCEGICRGIITREPQGNGGFGYDPVFYHEGLGKTIAQMSLEEKNKVSHRGLALYKVRKILVKDFLGA